MRFIKTTILILVLVLMSGLHTYSQSNSGPADDIPAAPPVPLEVEGNKVDQRIKSLEDQVRGLEKQLAAIKELLEQRAEERVSNVPTPSVATKDRPKIEQNAARQNNPGDSISAKKTKSKDLGFDAGDFRITPYGIIFFNSFVNSGGTNNADDPLWAIPSAKGNAGASGRQTRLGLRVEGERIGNANIKGVVEADFYGGFPGVGVGEHMGVVRLRLANVRLDWEKTSLLIGQDWIPFAPNNPTSLAAAAIPQFAAAGNPWSRLPQVRVDQKLGGGFILQGAVLAPGTGDFPPLGATPALLQPGSGAVSRMPFLQTRVSYSNGNWMESGKKGTIGLATHFGRSRVSNLSVTRNIDSYGIALDWNFWAAKRLNIKGEAFFGQNLGGLQAGIFQGYNTDFGTPSMAEGAVGDITGIRTRGGWIQVGWNIPAFDDRLNLYASTGIDDPLDGDLRTISGRNFRSQNFGYAFDAIYDISNNLSVGTEFRRLDTRYIFGPRDDFNHLNFAARFKF